MKILIFNDFLDGGGSELQVKREKEILENAGLEVWLLVTDIEKEPGELGNNVINVRPSLQSRRRITRGLKSFLKNKAFMDDLKKAIEKINPDVIHLNNISCETISVLNVVKKYYCVQTIRDCRNYCYKGYGINDNGVACNGCCKHICNKECPSGKRLRDKVNDWLEYKSMKNVLKLKKQCLNVFVAPSNFMASLSLENGIQAHVIRDVLKKEEFTDAEFRFDNSKIYFCFGRLSKAKGIPELLQAFQKFAKDKKCCLWLAGKIDENYEKEFLDEIQEQEKVVYLGELQHDKIKEILDKIYVVVVPSIVLENYPNTAIEGFARKRLVIGTNRAGTKEIIGDERFLFDVVDSNKIVETLNYTYDISEKEYIDFVEAKYQELLHNSDENRYLNNILEIFSSEQ